MSSGLTVKSIGAAQTGYARSDSAFVRASVVTELDPTQTVTAAPEAPAANSDALARSAPLPQQMSPDVLIDPQAREVIFRAMVMRAGRAIDEAPEEAMLKVKAYNRAGRGKQQAEHEAVEKTA